MRSTLTRGLVPLLAAFWFLGQSGEARAQVISNGEIERAFRPGAYVPYNGASAFERYNYNPGAFLYINGCSRKLAYLEYLDRVDRAMRFGRRPPPPPPWLPPSWVPRCTCTPPLIRREAAPVIVH